MEDTQERLAELRQETINFIESAAILGLAPSAYDIQKPSDLVGIVAIDRLPADMKKKVSEIHAEASDVEKMYVNAASQAIQALYEKGLPRIFYVIVRA